MTERYTHPNDWGLVLIVGVICLAVGALGSYLALAKSREHMAQGWRSCEERLDRRDR